MNNKLISIIALAVAVLAAGIAAIVVSSKRAEEAQALARSADAAEEKADKEAKAKRAEADKAADERRTAEKNAEAKASEAKAAAEARAQAEIDAKAAADKKAAKEAEAKVERAKAEQLQATRDAARLAAEKAKADQLRVKDLAAKAAAEADEAAAKLAIEKQKSDKTIAEAKLLELRKIDFERLAQELNELEADLREREAALKPEKTIADLSWAGGAEDSVIDEKGNLHKQVKTAYDPEKDMTLSKGARLLAKTERLQRESLSNHVAQVQSTLVKSLEKLYVDAIRDQRPDDADYYRKSIKTMYPDWEFKGETHE